MESADDVRASLGVASLADLHRHEATSPDGESRVAGLLGDARVLSWPLVVDAASGLILDGSHRAVVLARDLGARFALVQRVALDAPDVRIGTWCRVLEGVSAAAFDHARRALGLEVGAPDGLRCHYGGRVYARPGSGAGEASGLARGARAAALVERPSAARAPRRGRRGDVVARRVRRRRAAPAGAGQGRRAAAGGGRAPAAQVDSLPPAVPRVRAPRSAGGARRGAAGADRRSWNASGSGRSLCLGPGLAIDRRYPERLWQFTDHRIPDRLFADEAGRRAYTDALARATLAAPSEPVHAAAR